MQLRNGTEWLNYFYESSIQIVVSYSSAFSLNHTHLSPVQKQKSDLVWRITTNQLFQNFHAALAGSASYSPVGVPEAVEAVS